METRRTVVQTLRKKEATFPGRQVASMLCSGAPTNTSRCSSEKPQVHQRCVLELFESAGGRRALHAAAFSCAVVPLQPFTLPGRHVTGGEAVGHQLGGCQGSQARQQRTGYCATRCYVD